ncbi:MAG: hypothetical protein AB8B65_03950 [Kordia sp.]|uniref:hypothetical protein n=1 Tax=Kordia sp. TaxID=1965332 RepID=UPI00385F6DD8
MRENKKVLKFRKFKIANLQVHSVSGGTNSNPCVPTGPLPSDGCPTIDDHTCLISDPTVLSGCTKGEFLTNEDVSDCRLTGL